MTLIFIIMNHIEFEIQIMMMNRISSKAGQDPDSILAFKLPSKSSQSRPACKNLFDIRQLTVLQAFRDQAGNCENETVRCLTS